MRTIKKDCCPDCGFPTDLIREPVILRRNVMDLVKYETNKCDNCEHQKDGTTILSIHSKIQEMGVMYNRREQLICKFFEKFIALGKEERRLVAVWFPYDDEKVDKVTPYSWDVVAIELINRTTLGFSMLSYMGEVLK